MLVTMAVTTFFKLWQQNPVAAMPYAALGCMMILALVAAILSPIIAERSLKRYVLTVGGAFLAPQTLEVNDRGIITSSSVAKSEVPWAAILGRLEDEDNHYLFIDAAQALIIPKYTVTALGSIFTEKLATVPRDA